MNTLQEYAPKIGDTIWYRGSNYGIVKYVEGNLCWVLKYGETESLPFIWRFKDGLNALHDWPSRDPRLSAPCPGGDIEPKRT